MLGIICSDIHWSKTSSLVRARGLKYSVRLELLVKTMNWVNELAVSRGCDFMACGGDMMDKALLQDEEITALKDIKWNNLPCYFVCGNHESSVADLRYSSLKAIEDTNHIVYSTVDVLNLKDCDLLFLPYMVESDRQDLDYYLDSVKDKLSGKPIIAISHNEIAGIQFGAFKSTCGFTLEEIQKSNISLFLNGHLHNSMRLSDKVINIGSSSAHNFTNDSFEYQYGVWLFDTETMKVEFIENPYSLNFYKIEATDKKSLSIIKSIKNNAVLSIKCPVSLLEEVNALVENNPNVLEYRIIQVNDGSGIVVDSVSTEVLHVDHLEKFIEFCHEVLPKTDLVEDEIAKICV